VSAVLCHGCRRQLPRDGDTCQLCGASRPGAELSTVFSLVLPDGTRAPVRHELVLGRAAGSTLRFDDPAVSRRHACVTASPGGVELLDLGSSAGTFLDGHRVRGRVRMGDGQRLRLGDTRLRLERDRGAEEPARTVVVPVGASLRVPLAGAAAVTPAPAMPMRPRLRSGWALKRLSSSEGARRYVLADLRGDGFLRFSEHEAELLALLDGGRTVSQLAADVRLQHGTARLQQLAGLLAELGDGGMLAGGEIDPPSTGRRGRLSRLLRPRTLAFRGAHDRVDRFYRAVGFILFTRTMWSVMALVTIGGAAAFLDVLSAGDARPLHVAGRLTVGAAAYLAGRFAVVALHELGHALTLASFGRRARSIGLKLVLGFPYAFVDTSEAWFEPRRRRLAVSAAGPITDGLLAGLCSLLALVCQGPARDIAFQLSLGAYTGMLLNLNPLLERDGYHMLVDLLNEPNLRRRSRDEVQRRLAHRAPARAARRSVAVYGIATLAWSLVTAGFLTVTVLGLAGRFGAGLAWARWPLAALGAAAALIPMAAIVARGLRERRATVTVEAAR
jgi:putative peptide zinc metalloprotease protein